MQTGIEFGTWEQTLTRFRGETLYDSKKKEDTNQKHRRENYRFKTEDDNLSAGLGAKGANSGLMFRPSTLHYTDITLIIVHIILHSTRRLLCAKIFTEGS